MNPRLGVDCHLHIFDAAYDFADNPRYIPHPSLRGDARQFSHVLDAHGLSHALLVGAAPYGGDNGPILDAIRNSDGRYKGIALLPEPDVSDAQLVRLHEGGIVGIRVNLALGQDEIASAQAQRLLARIAELGWFLDIHCEDDDLARALPLLARTNIRLLIDHCGRPDVLRGVGDSSFQQLLELGRSGRAVAKLSGPFRFSRMAYPHEDTDAYFLSIIEAFGVGGCVWGSDWPFVNFDQRMDYGPQLQCLSRWLPAERDRRAVLWDTPARLFGFLARGD